MVWYKQEIQRAKKNLFAFPEDSLFVKALKTLYYFNNVYLSQCRNYRFHFLSINFTQQQGWTLDPYFLSGL